MCGGQPSPHSKSRLVISHITCPPLSSSPHTHSFVLGTAVINNNKVDEAEHLCVWNHVWPPSQGRKDACSAVRQCDVSTWLLPQSYHTVSLLTSANHLSVLPRSVLQRRLILSADCTQTVCGRATQEPGRTGTPSSAQQTKNHQTPPVGTVCGWHWAEPGRRSATQAVWNRGTGSSGRTGKPLSAQQAENHRTPPVCTVCGWHRAASGQRSVTREMMLFIGT